MIDNIFLFNSHAKCSEKTQVMERISDCNGPSHGFDCTSVTIWKKKNFVINFYEIGLIKRRLHADIRHICPWSCSLEMIYLKQQHEETFNASNRHNTHAHP